MIDYYRKHYQVVWWWPEWEGLRLYRFTDSWAKVYRWSLCLGFLEIRQWAS